MSSLPGTKRLDVHALACLDALVSEGHVTRAAQRIGIGQPAMSEMLARLRLIFDDPLLVRTRQGMTPTMRALSAAENARAALQLIDDAISGADRKDNAQAQEPIRIVMLNSLAFTLLPRMLARIQQAEPRFRISVQPGDTRRAQDLLEANECDVVIGYPPAVSGSLHSSSLYKYQLCCVVREDHPVIRQSLSLKHFTTLQHVALGDGYLPVSTIEMIIDRALREGGLTRKIAVRVPDFLISMAIVSQTDYMAVVPTPTANQFREMLRLKILTSPVTLADPRMLMIWHERSHRDAEQRRFRSLVRKLAQEI